MGTEIADSASAFVDQHKALGPYDVGRLAGIVGPHGGRGSVSLRADKAGAYMIATKGGRAAILNVESTASLRLADSKEALRLHAFTDDDESVLRVLDGKGNPRAVIGVDGKNGARAGLLDENQQATWAAP